MVYETFFCNFQTLCLCSKTGSLISYANSRILATLENVRMHKTKVRWNILIKADDFGLILEFRWALKNCSCCEYYDKDSQLSFVYNISRHEKNDAIHTIFRIRETCQQK